MVMIVGIVAAAIAALTVAAVGIALASIGSPLSLLDALLHGMMWMVALQFGAALVLAGVLISFVLRPIAASYAKIRRGEPLSKAWTRLGGGVLLAGGLVFPVAFLVVFFATTTFPVLASTFLGVIASPFLLVSGAALVAAREPVVA